MEGNADNEVLPWEDTDVVGLQQQIARLQALLEASETNADEVRLGVSLGVWNAYYALDSGNQQLAATTTLTQTAADNQQVALGRYQSGVGTIIDVLTAQSAAASARLLRINAEFGWRERSWRLRSAVCPGPSHCLTNQTPHNLTRTSCVKESSSPAELGHDCTRSRTPSASNCCRSTTNP